MQVTIFCTVVDNFGDIGICWRLAKQLQQEHHCAVLLYVDDLASFQRICPEVDPTQAAQTIEGIRVGLWSAEFTALANDTPQLLIEAFACNIPQSYLLQCQLQSQVPVWINLEYLTAESWAADCHGLASPQAGLSLKKYFYFPGFTERYGGLLREAPVVAQATAIRHDCALQAQFWQRIGIADAMQFTYKISVFAYSQQGISAWFEWLATQAATSLLLVPQGVLAQQLITKYPVLAQGRLQLGTLTVQIMPFIPQPDYDRLLACCDFNFVRGEDSIIRAHWAGRPFIWQIYRQDEQAHLQKLHAFLDLMLEDAPLPLADWIRRAHDAWEQEQNFVDVWAELASNRSQYADYVLEWQRKLTAHEDLASNLVRFAKNKHIIPRTFS